MPYQGQMEFGFKEVGGTSQEAAEALGGNTRILRTRILHFLSKFPNGLTCDEIAARMDVDILSVRPRMTELAAQGEVEKTNIRRRGPRGRNAVAWRNVF